MSCGDNGRSAKEEETRTSSGMALATQMVQVGAFVFCAPVMDHSSSNSTEGFLNPFGVGGVCVTKTLKKATENLSLEKRTPETEVCIQFRRLPNPLEAYP